VKGPELVAATPRRGRSTWQPTPTLGPYHPSTFRNYIQSEPRFRALLIECGARVSFHHGVE
jgi:hypothetical protein